MIALLIEPGGFMETNLQVEDSILTWYMLKHYLVFLRFQIFVSSPEIIMWRVRKREPVIGRLQV